MRRKLRNTFSCSEASLSPTLNPAKSLSKYKPIVSEGSRAFLSDLKITFLKKVVLRTLTRLLFLSYVLAKCESTISFPCVDFRRRPQEGCSTSSRKL